MMGVQFKPMKRTRSGVVVFGVVMLWQIASPVAARPKPERVSLSADAAYARAVVVAGTDFAIVNTDKGSRFVAFRADQGPCDCSVFIQPDGEAASLVVVNCKPSVRGGLWGLSTGAKRAREKFMKAFGSKD